MSLLIIAGTKEQIGVLLLVWLLLFIFGRSGNVAQARGLLGRKNNSAGRHASLSAVQELAHRWLPKELVSQIQFEVLQDESPKRDIFEYEEPHATAIDKVRVVIRGTTTSAMTAGLGFYFKQQCRAHISWTGDQWNETFAGMIRLPVPASKVRHQRQGKYSYYQNACTASYSMVWWDLDRWYRELDWMALSGINLPLAPQGQEIVWVKTFLAMGLTRDEIRTWLGGPAFMGWQRMGNLQAWGGPMPHAWMESQFQLQKRILHRMYSLGMKPVLPAFAGFVPPGMAKLFPRSNITLSKYPWGHFNASYSPVHVVEVTDPLFHTIGTLFLQMQRQLYREYFDLSWGETHYFSADTYNEMSPPSMDLTYLHNSSKSVFTSIRSVDPTAVWVMQGWLFLWTDVWTKPRIQAYLSGVDNYDDESSSDEERLIILDLMSEAYPQYQRSDYYFGKAFLFNMLHNFGQNHGMYGRAHVISAEPIELFQNQSSTGTVNIQGVGLTMEGINQNFVIYDLMTEMSWRDRWPENSLVSTETTIRVSAAISPSSSSSLRPYLVQWMQDYVHRRYGLSRSSVSAQSRDAAREAWQILLKTVYFCNTVQRGATKCIATNRPQMSSMRRGGVHPTRSFYKAADLHRAWKLLLDAATMDDTANSIRSLEPYRYDLVDLTRQALSDFLLPCHTRMVHYFQNRDIKNFELLSERFLDIMDDMESILATHDLFLLETQWLGPARRQARLHMLLQQTEFPSKGDDAKTDDDHDLVALYEFNARNQITLWGPNGEIMDYANKQFASLMSSYYRPRWELFVKLALDALRRHVEFDDQKFNDLCLKVEQEWQYRQDRYPSQPHGDTVQISKALYQKYVGHGDETRQHESRFSKK
jgi:alpha-N-acetylglucosaminidase